MDLSAIAAVGMDAAQARFEKVARSIASIGAGVDALPVDTVSLSQNAVELIHAKNDFETQVRVAHIADDMQKTLLSLLA